MKTPCKPRVIIGPFPPPYHGAGKNTAKISQMIRDRGVETIEVNTNPSGAKAHLRGLKFHLQKIAKTLINVKSILNVSTIYLVPDGGNGVIYSLFYTIISLINRSELYLHHRNFSHIYNFSWAMRAIIKLRPDAHHVFLTQGMGEKFQQVYGNISGQSVVSNFGLSDLTTIDAEENVRPIKSVGYLSNLVEEKGFFIVTEAFQRIAAIDEEFEFHIAGKPTGAKEINELERIKAILGQRLHYWGHVYGEEKNKFFLSVSTFLFPTLYKLEAQPNVIIEALDAGCFVIATDRACIPETLSGFPSLCIAEDNSLIDRVTSAVLSTEKFDFHNIRREIRKQSAVERRIAQNQIHQFITRLCNNSTPV